MKIISLALAGLLVTLASCGPEKYTINGTVGGASDSMKVYLVASSWDAEPVPSDSTFIKDGKFTFTGVVKTPAKYRIIIDATPKGEEPSDKNKVLCSFYLENSDIGFAGHIDSMQTYFYNEKRVVKAPVITGSATEAESVVFEAGIAEVRKQLSAVDKEYLQVYHVPSIDGKFNTEAGIALARKENALVEKKQAEIWKYISAHPKSVIAYDQAMSFFTGMYSPFNVKQIDELVSIVKQGWANTPNMIALEKAAENAKKTALGNAYQDFEFTSPEGKKVMLSQYVPKGKYVMLEFWASWCGPCRGEIPHLKMLNETKSSLFDIVSISLDESDANWKKAMKDEGMNWVQLNDPHSFAGDIAKAYNISGIPLSILLDKEGKIIKVGLRGAHLDAALEDLEHGSEVSKN